MSRFLSWSIGGLLAALVIPQQICTGATLHQVMDCRSGGVFFICLICNLIALSDLFDKGKK